MGSIPLLELSEGPRTPPVWLWLAKQKQYLSPTCVRYSLALWKPSFVSWAFPNPNHRCGRSRGVRDNENRRYITNYPLSYYIQIHPRIMPTHIQSSSPLPSAQPHSKSSQPSILQTPTKHANDSPSAPQTQLPS